MATQMELALSLGHSDCRRLRDGAQLLGASKAELAAIDRLEAGTAATVDVDRLLPLATACGLPWIEIWERHT